MSVFLNEIQFQFSQDGDGNDSAPQQLRVTMDSCGDEPYLVIHSERWAIDHPNELHAVLMSVYHMALPVFTHFKNQAQSNDW